LYFFKTYLYASGNQSRVEPLLESTETKQSAKAKRITVPGNASEKWTSEKTSKQSKIPNQIGRKTKRKKYDIVARTNIESRMMKFH
jgi:hypothetical protein